MAASRLARRLPRPVSVSISVSISVLITVCVDLVANDAAHHGPADGSNSAAIRQDGARDTTDAGADRSIPVLS